MDRDAERLALDVPERDVDRSDRRVEDAVPREEARPGHDLPQVLDPRCVLTDEDLPQVDQGAPHRLLPSADADLAQPVHTVVGVHDDEHHAVTAVGTSGPPHP